MRFRMNYGTFFRAPSHDLWSVFMFKKLLKRADLDSIFVKKEQTRERTSERFAPENAGKRRPFWGRLKTDIFRAVNLIFWDVSGRLRSTKNHTFDTTRKHIFHCRFTIFVWKICAIVIKKQRKFCNFWCQKMFQNSSKNVNFQHSGQRNWDF